MGKGKVSDEEMALRLAETARLLVRLRSYVAVEAELARRFGTNERTSRKWIKKVKDAWRANADTETSEEARGDLIAQLDAVLVAAWNHTVVIKDGAGNPVLDQAPTLANGQPNPGYMKPLVKTEAKVQQILHAISQLRALRGADKPARAHVTLDGDINVMPDIGVLPISVAASLRAELERIAPDGDLRQLAGQWFSQTGAVPEKG